MPAGPLCHLNELKEGCAKGIVLDRPGRDSIFLVKHEGTLHAFRNDCPHWPGSPLAWRRDGYLNHDATRIVCSGHGAEFEITTGRCTLGPCLGQSLTRVKLLIDAQGRVLLASDTIDSTHRD